jgi:hypothetical protein
LERIEDEWTWDIQKNRFVSFNRREISTIYPLHFPSFRVLFSQSIFLVFLSSTLSFPSRLQILQHLIHTIRKVLINLGIIIQRMKKRLSIFYMLRLRTRQPVLKSGGFGIGDRKPCVAASFCIFCQKRVGFVFGYDADETVSEGCGVEETCCQA